ncbi:MAG: hypothetical protein QGH94_10785 [Phycisphaerae bacterium]|jgi:hypothetical protein|nr:hypothetical protein [Phycisphaerae bacterium]MDP7288466.1 hypothetical protein [Phycisphaerae bacterium]
MKRISEPAGWTILGIAIASIAYAIATVIWLSAQQNAAPDVSGAASNVESSRPDKTFAKWTCSIEMVLPERVSLVVKGKADDPMGLLQALARYFVNNTANSPSDPEASATNPLRVLVLRSESSIGKIETFKPGKLKPPYDALDKDPSMSIQSCDSWEETFHLMQIGPECYTWLEGKLDRQAILKELRLPPIRTYASLEQAAEWLAKYVAERYESHRWSLNRCGRKVLYEDETELRKMFVAMIRREYLVQREKKELMQ